MIAQITITGILLRRRFNLTGMWLRMIHFVLMPIGVGIATALVLRYGFWRAQLDQALGWWYVIGLYLLAAGSIFVVSVAVSRAGPYGATCWRDLRVIASRFLPLKVI
jgi:hypothetical protein